MSKKKEDLENLPQRSPIKPPSVWKENYKTPTKLTRLLDSWCGKEWDKAYSDIKHKMGDYLARNPDLIEHMIDLYTYKDGDKVYNTFDEEIISVFRHRYYVSDGILHKVKRQKFSYYYNRRPQKTVFEFKGKNYYKHNDIWYEVSLIKYSEAAIKMGFLRFVNDSFYGSVSNDYFLFYKYGDFLVCTGKRQIGKREKKSLEKYLTSCGVVL